MGAVMRGASLKPAWLTVAIAMAIVIAPPPRALSAPSAVDLTPHAVVVHNYVQSAGSHNLPA